MSSSASDRLDQVLELYQSTYQYPDIDELTQLLCDIAHDEKMDILEKNSTLNTAALCRHMELVTLILLSVPQGQRLDVLLVGERTPLHSAAYYGGPDNVETILAQLTPEQQLTMLTVTDEAGDTAADYAELGADEEIERLLMDYQHRAEELIYHQVKSI